MKYLLLVMLITNINASVLDINSDGYVIEYTLEKSVIRNTLILCEIDNCYLVENGRTVNKTDSERMAHIDKYIPNPCSMCHVYDPYISNYYLRYLRIVKGDR